MLTKRHLEKYADVLLWALRTARKGRFRKNEVVLLRFGLPAVTLAEAIHRKLLDLGLNVILRSGMTPEMEHDFYARSNQRQLVFVGPWEQEISKGIHGSIFLNAPDSLTHLRDIDPKRIGKALVARKPLRDILRKREERGAYSWTLCTFPTAELARQAKLSVRQYANQIIRACYLDQSEPVKAWDRVYRNAKRIKRWVNGMDVAHYHIESDQIDLKITPGQSRRWIGISGHNIPSFEIFISPDWRGTEGVYYADQPSFRSGNYVEGVRLTFKRGRAVKIEAAKGRDFVSKQLSMDEGANRVGEFSLTDKRFSRINRFMANTLYDENYGGRYGNCHLAVGSSYTDSFTGEPGRLSRARKENLGFNDSALHWDLVNTEKKRVTAYLKGGGKTVVYENGLFKL
jgi:aminopeptidase